jgi:hypothetical protein
VVHRVRRYYVTPERWDTPGTVEPADLEWWCTACLAQYPHERVADEGATPPA